MLGNTEILASMTEEERTMVLEQQLTKRQLSRASKILYEAESAELNHETIGRLYGLDVLNQRKDNEAWSKIEEHFTLFQRRVILELGNIYHMNFPRDYGPGMITEEDVKDSLTVPEYNIIRDMEISDHNRDVKAGELNDAIDERDTAARIGYLQLEFLKLDDLYTKYSDIVFKTLGRPRYRILANKKGYWTDWGEEGAKLHTIS